MRWVPPGARELTGPQQAFVACYAEYIQRGCGLVEALHRTEALMGQCTPEFGAWLLSDNKI